MSPFPDSLKLQLSLIDEYLAMGLWSLSILGWVCRIAQLWVKSHTMTYMKKMALLGFLQCTICATVSVVWWKSTSPAFAPRSSLGSPSISGSLYFWGFVSVSLFCSLHLFGCLCACRTLWRLVIFSFSIFILPHFSFWGFAFWFFWVFLCLCFLFSATPATCGVSLAGARIRATPAGLCHSHNNAGDELHPWPTPQLMETPDP